MSPNIINSIGNLDIDFVISSLKLDDGNEEGDAKLWQIQLAQRIVNTREKVLQMLALVAPKVIKLHKENYDLETIYNMSYRISTSIDHIYWYFCDMGFGGAVKSKTELIRMIITSKYADINQ